MEGEVREGPHGGCDFGRVDMQSYLVALAYMGEQLVRFIWADDDRDAVLPKPARYDPVDGTEVV